MDVAAFAPGYLSLIQASTRGQGIRLAADSLVPTVDIGQALAMNTRRSVSADVFPIVTGENLFTTIPAGELWIVRAGHVRVSVQIGSTSQGFYAAASPPGAGQDPAITSQVPDADGTVIESHMAPFLYPGLMLGPGTVLLGVASVTGVDIAARLTLLVDVLRV